LSLSAFPPPPPLTLFPTRRSSDLRASPPVRQALFSRPPRLPFQRRRARTPAAPLELTTLCDSREPAFTLLADDAHSQRYGRKCADRKSTRLNSSHVAISYAVFCLK